MAQALLEGLEADQLTVVRADDNSQSMLDASQYNPRQLDEQIQEMEPKLEKGVANHRSM